MVRTPGPSVQFEAYPVALVCMSPECLDVVIILMSARPHRFAIGSLQQRPARAIVDPPIGVAFKSMHEKVVAFVNLLHIGEVLRCVLCQVRLQDSYSGRDEWKIV
jgi:hypothetical protein